MLGRIKKWFSGGSSGETTIPPATRREQRRPVPPQGKPGRKKVPRRNPEFVDAGDVLADGAEERRSGKSALIRNKYVREDTGTHETLKILDDSVVDTGEEAGIDPYNTGGFDRSKNWDKRFGK